jgi:hypothetical protein
MKRLVTALKFNELDDKAKEKAIEDWRQYNYVDSDDLKYELEEKFRELVGELFNDFELSYSFNASQGDGVSFEGKLHDKTDLTYLANRVYKNKIPENIEKYINNNEIDTVDFRRISTRYTHAQTVSIHVEGFTEIEEEETEFENAREQFEDDITEWYEDICYDLEHWGNTIIEGYDSEEYIEDILVENDYDFEEDGTMI